MEAAPESEPPDQDQDDDPPPARGELFGTETMAELCVRQGRIPDALGIYRGLLAAGTTDDARRRRWTQRLEALQHPEAALRAAAQLPSAGRPTAGAAATATGAAGALAGAPASASGARPGVPAGGLGRPGVAGRGLLGGVPRRPAHHLPLVIREPVRAGQIVYAERNDLIVLGPVNPGAQLIADGNIHVYSRLRGRAVAGAHGATDARIYCQRLEAELVGVDAAYLTAEDIPDERLGKAAQIFWQDGRCLIVPL